MEHSDKLFGVPRTVSAFQSFSGVTASPSFYNPFASVVTTTAVISSSSAFGQPPSFSAIAASSTSSTAFPLPRFNFGASSFPTQNSTFSFASAGEQSFQSIAKSNDSNVPQLFGKPVHDEPKTEQSEQQVKATQPPQLEPKRKWNMKLGCFQFVPILLN